MTREKLEITPIAWTVRFRDKGINREDFDASLVATHCLDGVVEVHMASVSKQASDDRAFVKLLSLAREEFKAMGYKICRYERCGEVMEEVL